MNAVVADINTRTRNEAVYLSLRFASKGAFKLFVFIIFTHFVESPLSPFMKSIISG